MPYRRLNIYIFQLSSSNCQIFLQCKDLITKQINKHWVIFIPSQNYERKEKTKQWDIDFWCDPNDIKTIIKLTLMTIW